VKRSPMNTVYAVAATLVASIACAGVVVVPNGSFEGPTVPNELPWAGPDIDTWQKSAMPGWWLSTGQTASDWYNLSGVFLNVGGTAGVEGNQAAFLFAAPGTSLSQDLTDSFQIGQSYHLTMAAEGGGYGMLLDVPMEIRLYYRDALNQPTVIGAATILNTNPGNSLTQLTDFTLDIPAVQLGDAWAGKPIGIEIASAADFSNAGGYWDIDNVRLTAVSVPEPALFGVLVPAGLVALRRRRRV
jgi:hypothetical protein